MDLGLNGKIAMVAAASKGLGKAVAESLAAEGVKLSLCARSFEESREANVLRMPCDVANAADLKRWFDATVEHFGQVDILFTNTGGPPAATFMQLSEEQWQSGIQGTLMNVVRLSQMVIPGMQQRKWGRIVHLTSLVAKQPTPVLTISSTLRAGLSALTKTLADQVATDGITVNAVLPGHFLTDRQQHLAEVRASDRGMTPQQYLDEAVKDIPMGRYGDPREFADVVTFLCSERASYVTGASIQVDGGYIRHTF
jgi:3-oxoacyl-[acyl-carrier protein] reductase